MFLSALIYNPMASLRFMEQKGVTKSVLSELVSLKKNFKSVYEQKCFILGMTNMINVP